MISPRAQLVLMHLTDSALPTGGFSHSLGMEDYMLRGLVHDPESYISWLHSYIRQIVYTEGLLARYAATVGREAGTDEPSPDQLQRVRDLDDSSHVSLLPRQIRQASASMGKRMARIIAQVVPEVAISAHYGEGIEDETYYGCPAIAFGLAVGGLDVDEENAVRAYLLQLTTSINQNAIRGIPIGQDAGQRALASAHPVIEEAVKHVMQLSEVDLGASAPGLELAQMHHEQQISRMFMS